MNVEKIREGLKVSFVGKDLRCVETCSSTNDLAWKAAEEGAPHGTVIFSESQSSGRGRRGRSWVSSAGTSLLCSIVLRPQILADRLPLVTVLGALAVTDMAEKFGVAARVRFPNDVYVGSNKLAGILSESRFFSSSSGVIVVGVGVNVNGSPSEFPSTSLSEECGEMVDREVAARTLLEAVDQWTSRLEEDIAPFREAWRDRSDLIGRPVLLRQEGVSHSGIVLDVHCIDGILLQREGGGEQLFRSEFIEKLDLV